MWRRSILLISLILLAGCGRKSAGLLGQRPEGKPQSIAAVIAGQESLPITVRGVMVEKCPVAGCWFVLRDETGTIRVDTKDAGFVVVDVPLKTSMTVAGQAVTRGAVRLIEATGLHY